MGWKQFIDGGDAEGMGLSENQCGMETWWIDYHEGFKVMPVEREPMWDGNASDNSSCISSLSC